METKNSTTRSVERTLEILECFLEYEELSLMEISDKTGLSISTVHRLAAALKSKHFIERDSFTKKYFVGSKINQLAVRFSDLNHDKLKKASYPLMLELYEKYNENVRLFVQEGESKLCIDAIESTRSLRQVILMGEKHHIMKGAAGKVLLAYMEEKNRADILRNANLEEFNLDKIKINGYALSVGEREEGLVGIAAPVYDELGKVIAALSISGPTIRFINEELNDKIADTIKFAFAISKKLGYIL